MFRERWSWCRECTYSLNWVTAATSLASTSHPSLWAFALRFLEMFDRSPRNQTRTRVAEFAVGRPVGQLLYLRAAAGQPSVRDRTRPIFGARFIYSLPEFLRILASVGSQKSLQLSNCAYSNLSFKYAVLAGAAFSFARSQLQDCGLTLLVRDP